MDFFPLGTSISWGTWQRTPVQTTQSSNSFQVRASAVSQLNKRSFILLTLGDKIVDGFSRARILKHFFILYLLSRSVSSSRFTLTQSHTCYACQILPSILVCQVYWNLKRSLSVSVISGCFCAGKQEYLGPSEGKKGAKSGACGGKTNLPLKKFFWAGNGKELPLSLLGWQTEQLWAFLSSFICDYCHSTAPLAEDESTAKLNVSLNSLCGFWHN